MSDLEQTQTTLRDSIENAIENHEPQAQTVDVPRDESGRFALKSDAQAEPIETKEVQPEQQAPQEPTVRPRPTSWKKDYEEHWTKLDPTLQNYIAQREADYAKGVSTYKQNWDSVAPIYEAMQPFMPLLQEHSIQPQQWISNLGNAHKTLALGSPEEKIQMFAKLANDYGVPLQALTGQGYDPQFSGIANELNQIKNEWTQFKTQREQQETNQIIGLIEDFASKNNLFDKVQDEVMGLLQSGFVTGATPEERLQNAYNKAIRLNDEAWQEYQDKAQQAKAQADAEARQRLVAEKKAKAVSPRSSSPTGMMSTGSGKKGLRDILAEQIDSQLGARV
jgi:hypothetical protein